MTVRTDPRCAFAPGGIGGGWSSTASTQSGTPYRACMSRAYRRNSNACASA